MHQQLTSFLLSLVLILSGCATGTRPAVPTESSDREVETVPKASFTADPPVNEVMSDPAFENFGRLLFPVDDGYWSGDTLGELRLTWYSHIDPDETVEIVNTLKDNALAGKTVFYDIYTEAEKEADPAKEDTGLFFFKGDPGKPFAVCNAGGWLDEAAAFWQRQIDKVS